MKKCKEINKDEYKKRKINRVISWKFREDQQKYVMETPQILT